MNPNPELVKQVAEEFKQIQNAPPIRYGATLPTCHFCGAIIQGEPKLVEAIRNQDTGHLHERFAGGCCA